MPANPKGGFAKCFRVEQPGVVGWARCSANGRSSAVKVVWKPSLKNSKQRQKLLSEIKIHQNLSHPNIVQFKHVFEDDENVYLILEYCEKKTFVDLVKRRKRLTDMETRFWMWQLLDGIRYMHRKGYIHRDIKLGNLFLDERLNLKIGDFGLAAQIDHDGERKKTICGTPNYIAPEILFDTKNGHSFEVDIWSLGVVMYTLLIGKPPFQTKDVKAIYKNIRDNVYAFPEDIAISDDAKDIITAFLHPKPESRPGIDDVMEHPYFDRASMPKCIPLVALEGIPQFNMLAERGNVYPSGPGLQAYNAMEWKSPPRPKMSKSVPALKSTTTAELELGSQGPHSDYAEQENKPVPLAPKPTLPPRPRSLGSPMAARAPLAATTQSAASNLSPLATKLANVSIKSSPSIKSPLSQPESSHRKPESPTQVPRRVSSMDSPNIKPSLRSSGSVPMSLPAGKPLGALERVFLNLKQALDAQSQGQLPAMEKSLRPLPTPRVFITKWIDYTNKYGLSYQLRDGSVGVYFNDGTSIILSADAK
ncbi:Cell cycle serine/threonine-protein kinase cdc5/MSD2 [Kappamyces sp. JEL0680]|nr:Cell cycle serine/threonine-protein kinase cdc5/MSD2 [Kappamyces sp. JEL0680]